MRTVQRFVLGKLGVDGRTHFEAAKEVGVDSCRQTRQNANKKWVFKTGVWEALGTQSCYLIFSLRMSVISMRPLQDIFGHQSVPVLIFAIFLHSYSLVKETISPSLNPYSFSLLIVS